MNKIKNVIGLFLFFYIASFCFALTGAKYLIITPDSYVSALQPLADWKTKKGVLAKIVPLSVTGSSYSEIKTYILNAYNNWQIRPEYIVLGGFGTILAVYSNGSSDDYYADMSGTYRNELCIGRLPFTNIDQCNLLVAKILGYERTPYLDDSLWFRKGATVVNEDNPPDQYYQNDARYMRNCMIDGRFVLAESISDIYSHNSTTVMNAINDGRGLIAYRGQAVSQWYSPFNSIEPNNLTNGFKLPIIVSGTCVTMRLSYTGNYGDRFMLAGTAQNPKGAVAYFGTTGISYSQYRSACSRGFFRSIFEERENILGKATKRAKFILDSIFNIQARYQEWNLFGDPELNIWTDKPARLTVTYDTMIYSIPQTFNVTVYSGTSPASGIGVCLMMDSTIYQCRYTNSSGMVSFMIQPQAAGIMSVTATAHNCIPNEGEVRISASSYEHDIGVMAIIEPTGNIELNTNITPRVKVKNYGTSTDTFSTTIIIGSVYNQTDSFQILSSGDTNIIPFPSWTAVAGIHQVTAYINCLNDQYHGNDTIHSYINVVYPNDVGVDAILSPDSSVMINQIVIPKARIKNFGSLNQFNFTATCSIVGANGAIRYTNTQTISSLAAGDTIIVNFSSWTTNIAEQCSVKIRINLASDQNPSNDAKTKVINVVMLMVDEGFNSSLFPPTGWQAEIVSGSYNWQWTSSGTIPNCMPFEGAGMVTYQSWNATSGSSARLITPMISVSGATRCSLKFMMMHNPEYASYNDQIQVQTSSNDTNFTTVSTFNRYTSNSGWTEHSVYLGEFTSSFYIAFNAISAWGNNMYLDYVRLFSPNAINEMENITLPSLAVTTLNAPIPNPVVNGLTNLSFTLAEPSQVCMKVYDATGKMVKTLVDEFRNSGVHSVNWNCRDDNNRRVAEGIYFYTLETPKQNFTKKLIITR